jgi:hypothetical protein
MSKADALVQLEKFFYRGLEHNGVKLPAVINLVRFNGISDKNNLSLAVDVGFKFSKLPWTLNE